jgi:hypothetical protein
LSEVFRAISRSRDGSYRVRLGERERDVLRVVPSQLRELLELETPASDPSLIRLFPPAYPEDPIQNLEYERLAGGELLGGRLDAIDVVERTAEATSLTEEELLAWLRVANDLRLVLGTRLNVTEESRDRDFPNEPESSMFDLYGFLGALVSEIVEAVGESENPREV